MYSVKDIIDFSSLPKGITEKPRCFFDILPSINDYMELISNFAVIVANIVTENIPFLFDFKGLGNKHLPHKFSMRWLRNQKWYV